MKPKTLLTILMIGYSIMLFSQTTKSTRVTISFGHAPDCKGYSGSCTFTSTQNKSNANTSVSFDKEHKELVLALNKNELDNTNKSKLLNNKLEKNLYLYSFDEDFILPDDIKVALGIKDFTKIKQGNYLARIKGDSIIIKLKLE